MDGNPDDGARPAPPDSPAHLSPATAQPYAVAHAVLLTRPTASRTNDTLGPASKPASYNSRKANLKKSDVSPRQQPLFSKCLNHHAARNVDSACLPELPFKEDASLPLGTDKSKAESAEREELLSQPVSGTEVMAPLNPSSFAIYHSLHSRPTATTSTSAQFTNCKFLHGKPRTTIHEPGSAPAPPGKLVTCDNIISQKRAELSISESVSREKDPRRQRKLINRLSSKFGKHESIITRLRKSLKQFEQPSARRSILTNVKGLEPVARGRALEAGLAANEKEAGVLLLRLAKYTRVPGIRLTTSETDNDMEDVEYLDDAVEANDKEGVMDVE